MSKIKIHQFDPVIYPFKLWVVFSNKLKGIGELFIDSETVDILSLDDVTDYADAFICDNYLTHKESNLNGFLVVFRNKKACTVGVAAHESSHLCDSMFKHINEDKPGDEPKAYLIEWIIESILEAKNSKNDK